MWKFHLDALKIGIVWMLSIVAFISVLAGAIALIIWQPTVLLPIVVLALCYGIGYEEIKYKKHMYSKSK